MPAEQYKKTNLTVAIITISVIAAVSIGPIYYLFHLDEKRSLAELEKKIAEVERQNRETERAARLAEIAVRNQAPTQIAVTPTKYINAEYHFEFMNPGWTADKVTDANNMWFRFAKAYTSSLGDYLAIMPYVKYNDYKPLPGNPVITNEKIGGKNSISKTWTSGSVVFKRFYIMDTIPGWVLCDQNLSNATSCGQIEYYMVSSTAEILQMVNSIKFN